MKPPPALLDPNSVPDWQRTPAALDALVQYYRNAAKGSVGSYFTNPTGNDPNFSVGSNKNPPGNFTDGTGVTFCKGSCKLSADGGGTLIVTGKLTNIGGFSFRGLIIVIGEEEWERNGAGNGKIIGNVVIAPYNRKNYIPQNISSTFLPPQYYVTGGGGSEVIYGDIGSTLNNTSGIKDFIKEIAEK